MPPKDKKAAPPTSTLDPFETAVWYFFVIVLLGSIVTRFFVGDGGYSGLFGRVWLAVRLFFLAHIFPILYILGIIFSILFLTGIIMALRQNAAAQKVMNDFYHPPILPEDGSVLLEPPKNPKWDRVMMHLNSVSQNDWKFAIIEADIMLSDLLETMRYEGDTVADRLKKVEKSDFLSIEEAWEGHKFRNQIAHEGVDLIVSEREARRVIELYRKVFDEFKII